MVREEGAGSLVLPEESLPFGSAMTGWRSTFKASHTLDQIGKQGDSCTPGDGDSTAARAHAGSPPNHERITRVRQ